MLNKSGEAGCSRSCTKEGWNEGLANDVDGGHVVDVEVGALLHRALHHGQRHAHEGARDGQLLLLCQLHHQILQPREWAVHNLRAPLQNLLRADTESMALCQRGVKGPELYLLNQGTQTFKSLGSSHQIAMV